jgi:hypothetical protein
MYCIRTFQTFQVHHAKETMIFGRVTIVFVISLWHDSDFRRVCHRITHYKPIKPCCPLTLAPVPSLVPALCMCALCGRTLYAVDVAVASNDGRRKADARAGATREPLQAAEASQAHPYLCRSPQTSLRNPERTRTISSSRYSTAMVDKALSFR